MPSPDITGYTVNNVNQITAANATPYSYDANGNLTDDGVRTYTWNADDRLAKINFKADPLKNIQIVYNGLGHWNRIITTSATGSVEQRFLWCGETLCQERTAADAVRNRFYPEGQRLNTQNFYYSRDHLGSVRDVLLIPSGAPAAPPYNYSAFGKPGASLPTIPASYGGLYYLNDAGLYLAAYRAYNPANGRWLSRDPIEEQGGINLYAYVNGNPVNLVDPLGLRTSDNTYDPFDIKPRFPYKDMFCAVCDAYRDWKDEQFERTKKFYQDQVNSNRVECDFRTQDCVNKRNFKKCYQDETQRCKDANDKAWQQYQRDINDLRERFPELPDEQNWMCE